MADMRDVLHDEIDAIEGLKERAREVVAQVMKDELERVLAESPDIGAAMKQLAELVEERLASLTTEAFQTGADFSTRRFGA